MGPMTKRRSDLNGLYLTGLLSMLDHTPHACSSTPRYLLLFHPSFVSLAIRLTLPFLSLYSAFKSDSFNSPDQSQMVADALKSRGWPHKLWLVEDYENDRGRPLEHGFDASDMGGQEVSGLEKNFAKLVWDDFLGPLVA